MKDVLQKNKRGFWLLIVILLLTPFAVGAVTSQEASIEYLKAVMDEFHTRFPVYVDVSSPGNHFHAWTKIPNQFATVTINGSSTNTPHAGATAIRCEFFVPSAAGFGGFYFQNGVITGDQLFPTPNFGEIPNAGFDLTGATQLTFWARGNAGGETIEFFMGGLGWNPETGEPEEPNPDSAPVEKITLSLTTQWTQYSIDLSNLDLSYVLGGFGWVASAGPNPNGVVFYLDDIQYELNEERQEQRLNEPRFLRSFTTEPLQPEFMSPEDFDFILRNVAFSYDNATALLAFLADATEDSLRRAKLIGDAFVYASQNDRDPDFRIDHRIRTAFAAGDISLPPGWAPNGFLGTVPVSGVFVEERQEFVEVQQDDVDVGNNTWTMMALIALYRATGQSEYLETAKQIGTFIRTFKNNIGQFQGFQGGLEWESPENPILVRRAWASTEHNLDIFAAFTTLYQITRDSSWKVDANHARLFIEQMFNSQTGCFFAGTTNPNLRNEAKGQLPLDTHSWTVLSLTDSLDRYPAILNCAEQNHRTSDEGFSGFDFNDDRDGVWFEGTAQMALAYQVAGQPSPADTLRQELSRAQETHFPGIGIGSGLVAASRNGVTSGFDFPLLRRLHVAATSWNIFAETIFNPFYDTAQGPTGRLILPPTGSEISQSTQTFQWNPGHLVTEYWLSIGTSQQMVANEPWGDIHSQSYGLNLSAQVSNIPLNGQSLVVRLWSKINDGWLFEDYRYTTPSPNAFTLDIDGNGEAAVMEDGLGIVRYLSGLRGAELTTGIIDSMGTRTTAEAIVEYLNQAKPVMLDVDGNMEFTAEEDGQLILRYLFQLRGDALIQNVIGPNATRTTAEAIETFLAGFMSGASTQSHSLQNSITPTDEEQPTLRQRHKKKERQRKEQRPASRHHKVRR